MRYLPGEIALNDLDIAQGPYFGGEWGVFLSNVAAKRIGGIVMTAAAVGAWTANSGATITAAGAHLQIVPTTYLRSAAQCVVTMAVTDEDSAATTAVGTFAPPEYAANQSFNFQRGFSVDLLRATNNDKKIKTVNSLTSIVGGAANVAFDIYELPALADYTFVGCTSEIDFNDKARMPKGVDCRMESDAFIKRGKSQVGKLTLGAKFFGMGDGLARFSGDKTTAMLVGIKDGQVTGDRLVFTQWVPSCAYKLPEGDGEAMANNEEGKYNELLMFVAPTIGS